MKIIFAHNCHDRPKTLAKTVELEKKYFPDSYTYLSLTDNGGISLDYFSHFKNTKVFYTFGNSWQLGCVNCFYSLVSKICEENEDGIIIFSHDDVRLTDCDVVKTNLDRIERENISYMVRRPEVNFGEDYYMMEAVYLRIAKIKSVFSPHNNSLFESDLFIPKDINNNYSAEKWLASKLKNLEEGLISNYPNRDNDFSLIVENLIDSFGYEHLNFGRNAWKE